MDFVLEGVDGTLQGNPLKSVIYQTNLNMLSQMCHIFDASLPIQNDDEPYENDYLECCFIEVNIYMVAISTVSDILTCNPRQFICRWEPPSFEKISLFSMNLLKGMVNRSLI